MNNMMHPYTVLNIGDNSTDDEVRDAYRRLVKQFPPDLAPERFQQVNAAYEVVKTAELRAKLRLFGQPDLFRNEGKMSDLVPPAELKPVPIGVDAWMQILQQASQER